MNVIITLPIDLIYEIAVGYKTVEIRKSCPTLFKTNEDIVWVKIKGADQVAMCFQVSYFEMQTNLKAVWERYHSKIGAPYPWWAEYVHNAKQVVIWHIKNVQVFNPCLSFSETFPGVPAPQSYIYTAKGIIPTKHRSVKKKEPKEGDESRL